MTSDQYEAIHDWLRQLWLHDMGAYAYIKPAAQWDLHAFFKPDEQFSSVELLMHRQAISRRYPSLPQKAGRALAELRAALVEQAKPKPAPVSQKRRSRRDRRSISVQAVVRPEPDKRLLARAVVELAVQQVEEAYLRGEFTDADDVESSK